MKRSFGSLILGVIILGVIVSQAGTKDISYKKEKISIKRNDSKNFSPVIDEFGDLFTSSAADTYCVVKYDFEPLTWQGWEQVDNTQQVDTFFHVDDFADLGGGDFGRLVPLEGMQSMWCGTRGNAFDPYKCSWVTPPGYGNNWKQILVSDQFDFEGTLTFMYKISYDCEYQCDFVYVEYEIPGGLWVQLAKYDSIGSVSASHDFDCSESTRIRFRFESDIFFSDQDDDYNSDGAVIVDSLVIYGVSTPVYLENHENSSVPDMETDGSPVTHSLLPISIDFEDFENASLSDKETDGDLNGFYWHADVIPGYGMFSGLASHLCDHDPCNENASSQIVFFIGSTSYGAYCVPDTPPCITLADGSMLCQNEIVVSPLIDLERYSTGCNETQDVDIPAEDLPELAGCVVRYTMYGDLPIANCVFYSVLVRSVDPSGCPGPWENANMLHYKEDKRYLFGELDISHHLPAGNPIQIAFLCRDACDIWFGNPCTCASHTPTPWFDNVGVYRYTQVSPLWSYNWINLFQDNFPSVAYDLESWVRADMAKDGNPSGAAIIPNDHIIVKCTAPYYGGIAEDPSGPRVYMHVKCEYIGSYSPPHGPKTQYLYGPPLEGSYGNYIGDDGAMWTTIQAASAYGDLADEYWFDLNDSLFTRGYMISYYFEAYDDDGNSTTLPENAEVLANMEYGSDYPYRGVSYIFEFTCLPTMASDILYVDDYHGIGTFWGEAEQYFNPTFLAVLDQTYNLPDRYDVNGPDLKMSNGPGSRAHWSHMIEAYRKVIWDSGDLDEATICNAAATSDKSDDQFLLDHWIEHSEHDVGLWICGDNIAYDMAVNMLIPPGGGLFGLCNVSYVGDSYYAMTGVVNPLVGSVFGSIFWGELSDGFYAYGGCPTINRFDYLDTLNSFGAHSLEYPSGGPTLYAGIQSAWDKWDDYTVRTMWWGFSFMYVRDYDRYAPIIRNQLMEEIIYWFQNGTNPNITGDQTPDVFSYGLEQNFPNPFNPSTRISFGLDEASHVSLRVYDPAGRQVRTLVHEHRLPGNYNELWDGKNEKGKPVASGIYFYRLTAGERTKTKKMVLLR